MNFPQNILPGFNFEEAIAMAELSRRAYEVFGYEKGRDIRELYNAIYKDEWEFAHYIRNNDTDDRALILRRNNLYAVVFRGTILTSTGFELTGAALDHEQRMIEYYTIPNEKMPPSRDAGVYEGMMKGFQALRDELELFFDVLVGGQLHQRQLVDLVNINEEERVSRLRAICAAICAALKLEYSDITVKCFYSAIAPIIETINANRHKFMILNFRFDEFNDDYDLSENNHEADSDGENNSLCQQIKSILDLQFISYEKILSGRNDQPETTSKTDSEKAEVYITGHSRGGTLATFAVLHLKRYWGSKPHFPLTPLKKYSLGSTKVGNSVFVEYYNNYMEGFSYRVQNLLDPTIYMPSSASIPFPHNLQLMIPGIEYVRRGEEFYAHYEHVREAYTLFGLGHQKLELDFGGPLKFTIPVPFPHGPDGYKDMLIQVEKWLRIVWIDFEGLASKYVARQYAEFIYLKDNLSDMQKDIDEIRAAQYE